MSDLSTILARIRPILRDDRKQDRQALETLVLEYVELVAPIADALTRCAGWVERGLLVEAISVADAFPRLLELGKTLVQENLGEEIPRRLRPFAPAGRMIPVVEGSTVQRLERAAMDLDRQETVMERHQSLALARAPLPERAKVIRELYRLDPNCERWIDELGRIEDAALQELRSELRKAVECGDSAEAERVCRQLDGFQGARNLPSELLREIKEIRLGLRSREAQRRYAELGQAIADAHSRADVDAVMRLHVEWARVQQRTGVDASKEQNDKVDSAYEWAKRARDTREKKAQFESDVAGLRTMAEASGDPVELQKRFAKLSDGEHQLPEGLEKLVKDRLAAARRERRQAMVFKIAVVALVVAALGGLTAWWLQGLRRAEDARLLAQGVESMLRDNNLPGARKLLAERQDLSTEQAWQNAQAKVKEQEPRWQAARHEVTALKKELEDLARSSDVTPTLHQKQRARWGAMSERALPTERLDVEKQLDGIRELAGRWVDRKKLQLASKRDEARRRRDGVPLAFDLVPVEAAFDLGRLEDLQLRCQEAQAEVARLAQEFAELQVDDPNALADLRREGAGFEEVSKAIGGRMREIRAFHEHFGDVMAAAARPDAFNPGAFEEAYLRLLDDCPKVLDGLRLNQGYKESRDMSRLALAQLQRWNEMVAKLGKVDFAELTQMGPKEEEAHSALVRFVGATSGQDRADGSDVAAHLLAVANAARGKGELCAGSRLANRLEESRMCDLVVVPLKNSGHFFRRPKPKDGLFAKDVIHSKRELKAKTTDGLEFKKEWDSTADPMRILPPPTVELLRTLRSNADKQGLRDLRARVLKVIGTIARTSSTSVPSEEGAAFRLWVVLQLAEFWKDELALSPPLRADLELDRLVKDVKDRFPQEVDEDWGEPVLSKEQMQRWSAMDAKCAKALQVFEQLDQGLAEDRQELARWSRVPAAMQLAGVAGIRPSDSTLDWRVVQAKGWRVLGFKQGSRTLQSKPEVEAYLREHRMGPVLLFLETETKTR